ncbi:FadR/GntR family transcriptional regulator [Pelomonas aquatica]|jgi:GntR family transcriptional repressor for pyruvate dehydrogenase complex|nr:FCD domain-containing protein [Pelomonas aquatica]MCY4754234.1 FCD domain-containing protein [Pelomonas aquatica]
MSNVTALSAVHGPQLSAQVARNLLALVSREHLRPGDAVPSELQIGKELGISRGSVREAYRSLAALGILEIGSGRRPRLKAIDAQVLIQFFDYALNTAQVTLAHVLETRRALEIQAAQLAARYATEAQRLTLRQLAAQMRSAGADHARRVASDMAIHAVIAEASGNPLNCLLLGALQSPLEESSRMHLHDSRSAMEITRVVDAHDAVVERICAADPMGAASAMSYHFDLALVHVERQDQAVAAGATPTHSSAQMRGIGT